MTKFAVIKTGDKQYKVREGDIVKVDKLQAKEGEKVSFDKVLLIGGDNGVEVGEPYLENKVEAEVKNLQKKEEGVVFRYKPKKRYRKKKNYRQPYTEVKITSIK